MAMKGNLRLSVNMERDRFVSNLNVFMWEQSQYIVNCLINVFPFPHIVLESQQAGQHDSLKRFALDILSLQTSDGLNQTIKSFYILCSWYLVETDKIITMVHYSFITDSYSMDDDRMFH